MNIIKVEGNKQIIRLNCVIKFCKTRNVWSLSSSVFYDMRTGIITKNESSNDIFICEDNISIDIPFKKGATEQKIDYNKKYKNSYFPTKEPLLYDINNAKLKEIIQNNYGFDISSVEVEDGIKFFQGKPVKYPKNIKVFVRDNVTIIKRKIKIKSL